MKTLAIIMFIAVMGLFFWGCGDNEVCKEQFPGMKLVEGFTLTYVNTNPPQLPAEFVGKYTDIDPIDDNLHWEPGTGIAPYPSPSVEIQTENLAFRVEELEQEQEKMQEIIQLLLDYYGVKIKYISEHMELVPETGN